MDKSCSQDLIRATGLSTDFVGHRLPVPSRRYTRTHVRAGTGAAAVLLSGCNRAHRARGLCRSHYGQQSRGEALRPLGPRNPEEVGCDFEGCGNAAVNKGLCQAHANQRKKGQPLRPLRPFYGTQGPCRFDGCSKPRVAGGFCAGHAAQYYGGRPLAPLWKPKVGCDFPGCTKRHFALGYCQGHWRQLREKRPLAPLREMKGWRIDRGYVFLFEPTHPNAQRDSYVAEHTKVMAARLGRPLEPFEAVGTTRIWGRPPGSSNTCSETAGGEVPSWQSLPVPLRVADGNTWPVATAECTTSAGQRPVSLGQQT
jgi:hypothetical protein